MLFSNFICECTLRVISIISNTYGWYNIYINIYTVRKNKVHCITVLYTVYIQHIYI